MCTVVTHLCHYRMAVKSEELHSMVSTAIYARVSTHDQADKGTSLETQAAEALKKADELGWQVISDHIIREDWTGKDLQRPGLQTLFSLADSGAIGGVIIHTLDRLYRPENDGDEWRAFEVLERLRQAGIQVVWVDATIPTDGPLASVFMFLDSWRSGRERRQMVERSGRGKREKARRGKVVNPHSLPKWLSYDHTAEKVLLDPEWAQVGRLLFQLAVEEGLPLRGISRRFHSLGLRSPTGETIWPATTIRNWLCNPAAKGILYQLRYESVERPGSVTTGRAERPREEWYELVVPPLVSEDVWETAQQQLRRNKEFADRNTHNEYLLRGLVKCVGCGRRMTGYSRARYSYYRCPVQAQKKYSYTASKCATHSVRADRLEPAVWEAVTELLKNPERLREEILQRRGKDSPTKTLIEEQLGMLRKRFSTIPAEQDRLVEGYGKGLIPDHRMKSRMGPLSENTRNPSPGSRSLRIANPD